jgi:hypothetical protein
MKTTARLLFFALATFVVGTVRAAEELPLDTHLEPLRPWLEKTWKGELKGGEKSLIDVSRWERALNGKAVRILHSVNDGLYGGESIIMWNEAKNAIVYHYFTTAGFTTQGTMTVKDGVLHTHELVSGQANDVTEVRGQTRMQSGGAFKVKTEYLKKGEWTPGRESTYREDSTAEVRFK